MDIDHCHVPGLCVFLSPTPKVSVSWTCCDLQIGASFAVKVGISSKFGD